jgi:UDP:flavonoid glycosyltransferase YjiC (YdhE family)
MARILFVTWPGGGNQTPAIGMAQALQQRGHTVTFAGYDVQRQRFEALGFPFLLLERSAAAYRSVGSLLAHIMTDVFASADHLRDVPDAIARTRCAGLVVDCLQFGALAAAEDVGLPVAVLVHTVPGLLVGPGARMAGLLLAPVNALRAAAGKPTVTRVWETWAGFPTLCATLAELDPLAAQVPASGTFVGPIFEHVSASGWRAPWPADDARPLVLVSFSTHPLWDQTSRMQRTLAALAGRPYRVLVATGNVDQSGLAAPENAALVPYVPHAEIMPQAAVCVTHAGHGTVTAALAAGVPLVCLPNPAADQPALAARVEVLGAGRALDGEACTAGEIATAVEQVLTEPSYAVTARRFAERIARMPSATIAASRMEALVAQAHFGV